MVWYSTFFLKFRVVHNGISYWVVFFLCFCSLVCFFANLISNVECWWAEKIGGFGVYTPYVRSGAKEGEEKYFPDILCQLYSSVPNSIHILKSTMAFIKVARRSCITRDVVTLVFVSVDHFLANFTSHLFNPSIIY